MRNLSHDEIAHLLAGSHQAVLSVSRKERGPIAIPMSFLFEDGSFKMITSADSQHGRLMVGEGRASLTVHAEQNEPTLITQWYVFAEGPVRFTDENPEPILRRILVKDRGIEHIEGWMARATATVLPVAVLEPERLSGYMGENDLSEKDR